MERTHRLAGVQKHILKLFLRTNVLGDLEAIERLQNVHASLVIHIGRQRLGLVVVVERRIEWHDVQQVVLVSTASRQCLANLVLFVDGAVFQHGTTTITQSHVHLGIVKNRLLSLQTSVPVFRIQYSIAFLSATAVISVHLSRGNTTRKGVVV